TAPAARAGTRGAGDTACARRSWARPPARRRRAPGRRARRGRRYRSIPGKRSSFAPAVVGTGTRASKRPLPAFPVGDWLGACSFFARARLRFTGQLGARSGAARGALAPERRLSRARGGERCTGGGAGERGDAA